LERRWSFRYPVFRDGAFYFGIYPEFFFIVIMASTLREFLEREAQTRLLLNCTHQNFFEKVHSNLGVAGQFDAKTHFCSSLICKNDICRFANQAAKFSRCNNSWYVIKSLIIQSRTNAKKASIEGFFSPALYNPEFIFPSLSITRLLPCQVCQYAEFPRCIAFITSIPEGPRIIIKSRKFFFARPKLFCKRHFEYFPLLSRAAKTQQLNKHHPHLRFLIMRQTVRRFIARLISPSATFKSESMPAFVISRPSVFSIAAYLVFYIRICQRLELKIAHLDVSEESVLTNNCMKE